MLANWPENKPLSIPPSEASKLYHLSLSVRKQKAWKWWDCGFLIVKKNTECIRVLDLTLITDVRWLFLGHFWPIFKGAATFGAAWSLSEIGLSLKAIHHSKVKLVQIPDTHGKRRSRGRKNYFSSWSCFSFSKFLFPFLFLEQFWRKTEVRA